MNTTRYSKYLLETLSTGTTSQLPISATCNAKCLFCSNNNNPFPIRREEFRSLEDVKRGLCLIDPKSPTISISDTLPGRMFEGEALLHPRIIEIFKLIRGRTQAMIQLITNGTLLTEELIKKLVPFKPIFFTVSYHSDDPDNWCRAFGLGKDKYRIAHDSFFLLAKNGFFMNAVIVPLVKLYGYKDVENTINHLRMYMKQIYFLSPAFSKKSPPRLRSALQTDNREFALFLNKLRKKYRLNLSFPEDPLAPLGFNPREIIGETLKHKFKNVAWLFSEAAYDRAALTLKSFNNTVPNEHRAFKVTNRSYGGTINCAGLLMVSDFRAAMKDISAKHKSSSFDLFVLPVLPFNRFGEDLMFENYSKLESEFKTTVYLR